MLFVELKYKLYKRGETKNGKSHTDTHTHTHTHTQSFREINLVLQLVQDLQIKSKTVMSWSSRKKEECIFCNFYFVRRKLLTFLFYLTVQCIE